VTRDYEEAIESRPRRGLRYFERVRTGSADLLAAGELSAAERLLVASWRIRACIETSDDAGAESTAREHRSLVRQQDADARWSGDAAGVAVMKATAWDQHPDQALGYLLAGIERVEGSRVGAYIDLRRVELLMAKARGAEGPARARAAREAVALCDAHADDERFAPLRRDAARMGE
jgi:hypothetical protein